MRRLIVLGVLVLGVAACAGDDSDTGGEPTETTTVSAAPTTMTTATTSTTIAATTTTRPYEWTWTAESHAYEYQSVGYSCGADPITGCDGDALMYLDEFTVHKEPDSTTADCLDFVFKPQQDSQRVQESGPGGDIDWPVYADTGWGVRLTQLDSPPTGIDIGGEAWLEFTVSSVSAADFAAREPEAPSRSTWGGGGFDATAPTQAEPVVVEALPDSTNIVERMVLVATTDDMMQWIIALTDDQTYRHHAGYAELGGGSGLTLKITADATP